MLLFRRNVRYLDGNESNLMFSQYHKLNRIVHATNISDGRVFFYSLWKTFNYNKTRGNNASRSEYYISQVENMTQWEVIAEANNTQNKVNLNWYSTKKRENNKIQLRFFSIFVFSSLGIIIITGILMNESCGDIQQ